MKRKAVALLSGGLDSMLAVRVVLGQGVPVTAVRFMTHFGCDADGTGSCGQDVSPLIDLWGDLGLDIKYCHLGEEYVKMVQNPKFGYGKNMNPCVDCRVMMLTWAKDVMEKEDACCVITGEVLNQRPMSQTREKFKRIDKETGLQGRVLRPLSAKLLDPTIAEQKGLIDRQKLLRLHGRGRTPQYEMAKEFGITDIPQPAGGCLLTDPNYSTRLRDLWKNKPEADVTDINLLKVGRHFRPRPDCKIIVGRNKANNEEIALLAEEGDVLVRMKDYAGPVTLVRGTFDNADLLLAASLTVRYGDLPNKREGARADVLLEPRGDLAQVIQAGMITDEELAPIRVGGK